MCALDVTAGTYNASDSYFNPSARDRKNRQRIAAEREAQMKTEMMGDIEAELATKSMEFIRAAVSGIVSKVRQGTAEAAISHGHSARSALTTLDSIFQLLEENQEADEIFKMSFEEFKEYTRKMVAAGEAPRDLHDRMLSRMADLAKALGGVNNLYAMLGLETKE